MVNFFRQVLLLLWKNFVIQRRKVCVSVFEVILPLLFAVIVLVVRILVTSEQVTEPKIYPNKTIEIYKWYKLSNTFIYAPNNAIVDSIMDEFLLSMNSEAAPVQKHNFSSMGFPTEEELLNYYTLNPKNISIAIVFEDMTATTSVLPKNIKYSLRPKEDVDNWRTANTVPFVQTGGPRTNPSPDYIATSFLVYQTFMDQAIIKNWNSTADFSNINFEIQKMPYPPYFKDPMLLVLQQQLPLLLLLSFILNVIMTAKNIIYEKERKLKESMKLMGLSNAAHWTAWFLTVFIYLTIAMIIYTLLMGLPISPKGPVLTNTDPSIIFVFLMSYGLSIIAFSFLISVFFNKANVGAAAAGILFFATYVPYFFIANSYQTMTRTEKLAACLLSTQAMSMGAYTIGLYEGTGDGIQWNNIAEPATVDDNFSMLDAILMMLGDTAIYMLIVWYVDNVHPGEFGVPKPFYFPFTRSYWCGNKTANFTNIAASTSDPAHFEKEPAGMKAGVIISGLKKEFKTGGKKKKAVNNMNLNMLEGQISVLLGHNGAGKTTTMSMLTGFITPTAGTAIVNGYDITTDIAGVRESLGLCPQHNILFDSMTVDEHLEFFALLKGADRSSVKAEIATMAQEIGLETKRSTRSMHLSGGQKRKLSVGIALISGSKIIILDEPTSGMDPAARRQTWDILQRNRANRTIILTTHFMDEADLLGDRIAIMSEGEVKCCGSSHFLKKLHGAGYHLVIVKSEKCNVFNVTQVVQKYVPSSVLESQISAEISYLLPNEESAKFPALFREIEDRKNELGINSFGTSATTMEEVFLKVGEGVDDEDDEPQLNGVQNPAFQKDLTQNGGPSTNGNATEINIDSKDILAFNKGFKRVSGFKLEVSRFYGMFIKKAIHTWRNKVVTLVQLLIPVLATAAALALANVQTDPIQKPSLTLNLAPFGGSLSSYGVSNATTRTNDLSDKYGTLFPATVDTTQKLTATEAQDYNSYFVSKAAALGTRTYNRKMVIGAEFSDDGAGNTVAKMWYNGQPYHSAPISVSYMMNTFAKYFSGDDYEIETRNYPLPADAQESSNSTSLFSSIFGFLIAFCILFGMAFLSSSFVVFLIKEKQFGAKHLQKVSGVGTMVYWLSNITWDFINYLIPCVLIIAVFGIFGTEEYLSGSNLGYVSLAFLLYGLDILPFVYLMQYLFTTPATGMVVLIIINIFTGLVSLMAVFILSMPGLGTADVSDALDWIFSIVFPQFNLGRCIMNIYTNYNILDACGTLGYPGICSNKPEFQCCLPNYLTEDYLSMEVPGIGRYLLLMVIQAVVFFGFTLLIEAQIMQKLWYNIRPVSKDVAPITYHQSNGSLRLMEDDDVANEKARLANMSMDSAKDSFILKDLFKRYGSFVAVDHISVGIAERECFGLLGQNGAGKTTTFKMLTGDVMLTDGNAYLESNDIKSDIQKVQENMGYCPQFDALIDQMTGRETLYMYGRLRGVPEDHLKGVVNSLIDILMLRKHADKKTQIYSGGNKRKLSVAIALIGDPGFILLDEPSSGVDPRARRQLWNVLSMVRDSGKTLILTSHSMEECDALCTRVAIMVNGVFKCLGSPQHLKNKFGQGYTLICRMKTGEEDGVTYPTYPLVEFIKQRFPSAVVFDDHQGYAHFQIPDKSIPLAGIFEVMEKSKEEYSVEDYSVHQTTLEQVFLTFTGKQIAPRETKSGLCQGFSCC